MPVLGHFWHKNSGNGIYFLKKNSGIGVLLSLEFLRMPRFAMINNFPIVLSANTGQKPHPYSRIGSPNAVKILRWSHDRNSWST